MPRPVASMFAPPPLRVVPMDLPPLVDDHVNVAGFYIAVAQQTSGNWKPAQLWWKDDYRDYEFLTIIDTPATVGQFPQDQLFATNVDDSAIEVVSSVDVYTNSPNGLSAATVEQVDVGKNWAAVGSGGEGWEIIKFTTPTPGIDPDVYTLTNIHRGQLSTDELIATVPHKSLFVLLERNALFFLRLNRGAAGNGKVFSFKAVMDGADLADAQEFSAELKGNTLLPYRPRLLQGVRDGANDLTISWNAQSRYRLQTLASNQGYDLVDVAGFTVEVLGVADAVIRSTDVGAAVRTIVYTAVDQTADGLTPGDPVKLRVVARSGFWLRGKPVIDTV